LKRRDVDSSVEEMFSIVCANSVSIALAVGAIIAVFFVTALTGGRLRYRPG
jgi:hypothetical protein